MRNRFNSILIVLLVMLVNTTIVKGADMKNIQTLSLIEVIANAQEYDGKAIRVVGFLNLEFESKALYLSRDDAQHSVTKNALWVELEKWTEYKKFNKHYVLIEGIFDANNKGHLQLYSGSLTHIKRLILWGESTK